MGLKVERTIIFKLFWTDPVSITFPFTYTKQYFVSNSPWESNADMQEETVFTT